MRVRVEDQSLELWFCGPFTKTDLQAVKAIPGRQWHPNRRSWLLPNTSESRDALALAFGSRLEIREARGGRRELSRGRRPASSAPSPDGRTKNRILEAMRRQMTAREYSPKTQRAYLGWVGRFLDFHDGRVAHPERLSTPHARAFLEHLAIQERLAAKTRNQAASALAFMFRETLGRDDMDDLPRARDARRVPIVLSHREVLRVLACLTGKHFLIAALLYSAGLRLEECLRLRVKDVDFELRQLLVRDGKGRKDRYVPLADRAAPRLRTQIAQVAALHEKDRQDGHGWAALPGALHRKDPSAGYELGWQYVFQARTVQTDPATGRKGRSSLHPSAVQRKIKAAVRRSGVTKRATGHTLRHSFATEALRGGCDIRTLQHVMGHKDVRTTMLYLHVVEQTGHFVRSPFDRPSDPDTYEYEEDPIGQPYSSAEGRRPPAGP